MRSQPRGEPGESRIRRWLRRAAATTRSRELKPHRPLTRPRYSASPGRHPGACAGPQLPAEPPFYRPHPSARRPKAQRLPGHHGGSARGRLTNIRPFSPRTVDRPPGHQAPRTVVSSRIADPDMRVATAPDRSSRPTNPIRRPSHASRSEVGVSVNHALQLGRSQGKAARFLCHRAAHRSSAGRRQTCSCRPSIAP